MPYVPGTIPGLDCSDDAQNLRRQQLLSLRAKIASGVSAVGDRGRSVTYRTVNDMLPVMRQLEQELVSCELGYWWPGRKRLAYIDIVKGL